MSLRVFLAALLLMSFACGTQPIRTDPLAGLGAEYAQAGPYRDLTIALVLSETTLSSMEFMKRRFPARFEGERIFEIMELIFSRHFKAVVKIRDLSAARTSGADLAVVLDVFTEIKSVPKYEAAGLFFTVNGKPLATIRAQGAAAPMTAWDAGGLMRIAEGEIKKEFETALLNSEKLTTFATTRLASLKAPPSAPASPKRDIPYVHSDVEKPGYHQPVRTNDFALIIGIEEYADLPPAQFAKRDAEAVARHFEALGVPRRNIIHLSNSRATGTSLKKYLESWLPRNVKASSRLYFYYSGHGAPDPTSGEAYIIPWDGDPNFLEDTAYPISKLYANLNALKAREIVVALDACFTGAGGRSVLAKGARPLVIAQDINPNSVGRLTILAAASRNEITTTLDEKGHGMFTYFFLKGLDGAAKNDHGDITAASLFRYLKPRVQDEARRQNREQTPTVQYQTDVVFR